MRHLSLALLFSLGTGCGEMSDSAVSFHFLHGNVTSTRFDARDGHFFLRLVEVDGKITDRPLYVASCTLAGPACDYQIIRVAEGEYTAFGLIDRDGDSDPNDPLPDTGDLFSPGRPLLMLSGQLMDFPDQAWSLVP